MASTKAPLFGLDASGQLGGAIVFSKWKGRKYVRELVTPSNPQSGLQVGMRAMLKFITQIYSSLSAGIKTNWDNAAASDNITGLNAAVRENQRKARINEGALQDPTLSPGAVEAAPTAGAATAQPKSVKLTWTDSAGADDWCTFVYESTVEGFVPSIATLIAVVPKGVQTFTSTGLKTGTTYRYRLQGCEKGSTLGTLAAQLSATPT
jgi:hypothetical protein